MAGKSMSDVQRSSGKGGGERWRHLLKPGAVCLVTGAAGLIGHHLCRSLLRAGCEVIALDDLSTGLWCNIEPFMMEPGFCFVEQDVVQPMVVRDKLTAIFHLACPASPVHYQKDSIKTTRTLVLGMLNILELARQQGVPVVQASTSEVYGSPLHHPQREVDWGQVNPIGPRACYDEGKRCAESLCMDYHRQYGVPVKIARIFNTYGPGMHPEDGRVVVNFLMQALRGESLTLYGDGLQTRSFCYVADLVEGLLLLAASPPAVTGPVNLGNPHEVSMLALAEQVVQLTEVPSEICFKPLPQDDPPRRQPDITLAYGLLGWKPTTSLAEGLRYTLEDLRTHI